MRSKLTPATPDIRCEDVWPPGTFTVAARAAYQQMVADGQIVIKGVSRGRHTGKVTVRYLAAMPHEWALERLGEIKYSMREQQTRMAHDGA